MRKSSAPSQIGSKSKRPRFSTPYLGLSDREKENLEISETVDALSTRPRIRSNEEMLKLISGQQSSQEVDDFLSGDWQNFKQQDPRQDEFADRHLGAESNGTPNQWPTIEGNNSGRRVPAVKYFSVVWCKLSKKKHKTWEGDAILKVKGTNLFLLDMEGKEIGHASGYKTNQLVDLAEGRSLIIGSKEVEVTERISEEKFNSGKCFSMQSMEVDENIGSGRGKRAFKPFVRPLKSGSTFLKKEPANPAPKPPPPDAFVLPRPSGIHEWNNNPEGLAVTDVWVEPFIARHLRPHQKEGVAFLYKCILGMNQAVRSSGMEGGAILADEMGLGKTVQCISLIWTLYKQGPYGGKPILKRNWLKEFKKWLTCERLAVFDVSSQNKVEDFVHSMCHPVMIISYDMLVRKLEEVRKVKFDLLICDEGHKLKNSANKTTQSVDGLNIKRRIILTGTPVQNDLQELYNLVDFCVPNILGSSSSFKNVFENPILASRQPKSTTEELKLGQERAFQLNQITNQLILRRTQEVNNKYLPPKVDIVLFCSLSPLQLGLYNNLVNSKAIKSCLGRHSSSSSSSSSSLHRHLACMSALRKLCNHQDLIYEACRRIGGGCSGDGKLGDDDDDADSDDYDYDEETQGSSLYDGLLSVFPTGYDLLDDETRLLMGGKMKVLLTLLKSFEKEEKRGKVVVVSNYTKTLDLIASLCKSSRYQFLRLDGKTPMTKRQEVVDRFNNPSFNDFIFLLSTKAGGVGLNLIGASRLVLFDIDWNPANDLQAMARIWRDGQKRKVFVYRLLSSNTIEERMYQRQVTKQGLSGVVVDLKSADSKSLPSFSMEQLKELFSPVDTASLCMTHDMLSCSCCRSLFRTD